MEVIFELLRLFFKTLSADDKCSLCNIRTLPERMKCSYLKNLKYFEYFFLHFRNLHEILNIFEKKLILIAYLFQKLQTVK